MARSAWGLSSPCVLSGKPPDIGNFPTSTMMKTLESRGFLLAKVSWESPMRKFYAQLVPQESLQNAMRNYCQIGYLAHVPLAPECQD